MRRVAHHRRVDAGRQAPRLGRHRRGDQPERHPAGQGDPRGGGQRARADREARRGGADVEGTMTVRRGRAGENRGYLGQMVSVSKCRGATHGVGIELSKGSRGDC